ncbi:ribonuclease P protein component [Antarcticibacterium flavum]|uniref:Ribonuclease P protein component n=1 Tax=Antarcticibacterium flavum TaxID=2058175 RepID=A0A5B7X4M9_9FLAO|nr:MULTISPECIES: ribonuclease P protein component [Antarcticibacterium]MCM4160075.1 ribonuclease P protein component [Antarcticibacterium sp. W02-3]QCY69632.1 ribonuclease P protein component [Antarcticibacterium flavum]
MTEKFPSAEKLKSKILIDRLFAEGRSLFKYPIKLIYIPVADKELANHKTGVSVPKRNFKKAVDRNYLKRLMREAYRKNKYLVNDNLPAYYAFMFIYTGKERISYSQVENSMIWMMKKLNEKEKNHEKSAT